MSDTEINSIISNDEKYVVLMETSGQECESWLYFIKYGGNEVMLKYLQEQLENVEWYILDDLSTFDLDLEHFVSSSTAKEMTKIELNSYAFHRKFDGKLQHIKLNLKNKDKNEKKMVKIFDVLGYGQIEDYIDNEDLDESDLTSSPSSDDSLDTSSDDSDDNSDNEEKPNKQKGIPKALLNSTLPRFAKAKRRYKK